MITIVAHLSKYVNSNIKSHLTLNKNINKKKPLFWKQEELGNNRIAIDITKRKLLFFSRCNKRSKCIVVTLQKLQSCTVQNQYHSISAGSLTQKKLQDYLKSTILYCHFKNGAPAMALPFYDEQKNTKEDAQSLALQAKEWQNILSQLLARKMVERA